jgi:hypothetical protein
MNKKDKKLILEIAKVFDSCHCCPMENYKEELRNYHNSITEKDISSCAKRAGTIYLLFGGNAKYFLENFIVGRSLDCDKFIKHLREFKNNRVLKI